MAHFLVSTSGTLSAGATSPYAFAELDLSNVSPSLVRTYGVDITVNGTVQSLAHRPFTERNDFGGSMNTGTPRVWMHYQTRKLAITPAPDSSYAYTVWYLPVLADLSADGDTFDGVAGWEDYITNDVCLRLVARDQYASAYALLVQNAEQIWRDILRGSSKVTAAGGANVGRDTFGGGTHGIFGRRSPVMAGAGNPGTHSVTNAMLAEMPEERIKGRARGAGTGDVTDLTPIQVAGITSVFSGLAAGLVPTGTGLSTRALFEDGQWRGIGVASQLAATSLGYPTAVGRKLGMWSPSGVAEAATGIHVQASGVALGFGADPATSGYLRLPRADAGTPALTQREVNGQFNVTLISLLSDNVVRVGSPSGVELDLSAAGPLDMNLGGLGNAHRFSSTAHAMSSGMALQWAAGFGSIIGPDVFAGGRGNSGAALSNIGTINGRAVDWQEPLRGALLTDADVERYVGLGNRYTMPSGVLSTGRTITVLPTGATVGEVMSFERLDTSANTLTIANGGPGGSGTIYQFPASSKRAADLIFASATSWTLAGHVRLS